MEMPMGPLWQLSWIVLYCAGTRVRSPDAGIYKIEFMRKIPPSLLDIASNVSSISYES